MGAVGSDAVSVVKPLDGSDVSVVLTVVPTAGEATVVGGTPGTPVGGVGAEGSTGGT
jgi:hypothetical protein